MKPKLRQRLYLLRTYSALYARHLDAGADLCFYCGEPRACLDHRPPLAVLDTLGTKAARQAKIPLVLLPSCEDCNIQLADRPLLTAPEALEWLTGRLERQYEKHVAWTREEAAAMSPMFKRMIKGLEARRSQLLARVHFIQKRCFDGDLMPTFRGESDEMPTR